MTHDIPSGVLPLLDSMGYATFELDMSGIITDASASFCSGVGYSREEIVGRHYRRVLVPGHVRDIVRIFDAVYRTGQPARGVEYRLRRRDGAVIFAEGAVSLVRDANGQPARFWGILHDITDRKQAEQALLRAKGIAEQELEIGRRIQAGFLPGSLPQLPGWEIAARFQAAREVAGDFYDVFTLASGKRNGLVVGDVCGKGVGAALFMALFRSLIRAFADQHYSLSWMDVLSDDLPGGRQAPSPGRRRALLSTGTTALKSAVDLTNKYIARNHGRSSIFATVFFGVLDPMTGTLMYINAGHEPPLVIDRTGVKARLDPTGPAVGLFEGMDFGIGQVELEADDILIVFTDGLTDARSPDGEFFSEERLLSLVKEPTNSAAALLDRIQSQVEDHIAHADQFDDITMLAVRRKPLAEG